MQSFFTPELVNQLAALLATVFAAVILPGVTRLINVKVDQKTADQFDVIVRNGLKSAISNLTAGKSVSATIHEAVNDATLRTQLISFGANYVRSAAPGLLKKTGLDPKLEAVVEARLDGVISELSSQYTNAANALTGSIRTGI